MAAVNKQRYTISTTSETLYSQLSTRNFSSETALVKKLFGDPDGRTVDTGADGKCTSTYNIAPGQKPTYILIEANRAYGSDGYYKNSHGVIANFTDGTSKTVHNQLYDQNLRWFNNNLTETTVLDMSNRDPYCKKIELSSVLTSGELAKLSSLTIMTYAESDQHNGSDTTTQPIHKNFLWCRVKGTVTSGGWQNI